MTRTRSDDGGTESERLLLRALGAEEAAGVNPSALLELAELIESDGDEAQLATAAHEVAASLRGLGGASAAAAGERLATTLRELRRDRELLRSTPMPALPRDFVAELALSAGALLPAMPQANGAWPGGWPDRRFGRRFAWRRAASLALAACLGGAVTAAILTGPWGAGWWGFGAAEVADAAGPETATGETSLLASGGSAESSDPLDPAAPGDLHHAAPAPGSGERHAKALAAAAGTEPGADIPASGAPTTEAIVLSQLALTIEAESPEQAIAALREAVEQAGAREMALVRNFRLEEAIELERRWLASRRAAPGAAASRAVVATGPLAPATRRLLVDRAAEALALNQSGGGADPGRTHSEAGAELGAHIAGVRELAAPPAMQLELSEAGFDHTLTVPASQVTALLEALSTRPAVLRASLAPREAPASASDDARASSERTASARESDAERWRRWREASQGAALAGRVAIAVRVTRAPGAR